MTALLSDTEIRELCKSDTPLLADFIDFDRQLQPTGFDVTVRGVHQLVGVSQIGGPYNSKVAEEVLIRPQESYYTLAPGAYLININEYVALPNEIMGLIFPRSTLFRCGGILQSGVWDGGFNGRGRLGLLIQGVQELKIEENCPIAQMVFFRSNNVDEGFKFNEFYKET